MLKTYPFYIKAPVIAERYSCAGMFLSIPSIAVLKIIFDRIDGLKPWGKLLGDNIPTEHMGQVKRFRRKKKLATD
jgi:AI-2 transport protein TqsA